MSNSIYFNEYHQMLRNQVRRFVETEIIPHGDPWEEAGATPREVLRKMGELGFLGIRYGAEYGGSEMDVLATIVLAEELGRSTFGGFAITVLVHTDMASPHLANAGSLVQQQHYMPGIVKGETITAVAVTEPGAGSDVASIQTKATPTNGGWLINGSKVFITNGVHADVYFVAAKTNPDGPRSQRTTMFIVEKGSPGFTVARKLEKMGWRSSDTAELLFQDCFVSEAQVLGEQHHGFYAIMKNFQNERLVLGAQALGEAQKSLDLTLDYVRNRKAFGATLWDKQAIRLRLAERQTEVEAARQLLYHSAWLDSQGVDCVKQVSMVKAYCGELVNRVMYDCQQFHGGSGYMRGMPIERMVRDARVQSIGGGATEVMYEEVAKRL